MSSLIFYTDAKQVLIVTDTLSVTPDGSPFLFTSKAHYLPHLRTIVAGTGVKDFSSNWHVLVNNGMVVRGIENLNDHTPQGLREMWQDFKEEYSVPEGMTTTVYHLGISEETGQVVAYAYRSINDFVSELVPYGVGIKPECTVPTVDSSDIKFLITEIMKEQRRVQAAVPLSERIFIGGEAIAMQLTKGGCNIFKLFEFDDFPDQSQMVFDNFTQEGL